MLRSIFLLVFMACAYTASCGRQETAGGKAASSDTITIRTKIYCDHCMECGSCAARLNMALRSKPGVKKVEINPEANTIFIKYNSRKTDPDKLRKLIADAGFDADDRKASAEAVNKLDDCCKPE